jgi:hypothetical protein
MFNIKTFSPFRLPGAAIFEKLRSHRDQRDFVSSGAAAGIAAGWLQRSALTN